jgi:hypothetical protein
MVNSCPLGLLGTIGQELGHELICTLVVAHVDARHLQQEIWPEMPKILQDVWL